MDWQTLAITAIVFWLICGLYSAWELALRIDYVAALNRKDSSWIGETRAYATLIALLGGPVLAAVFFARAVRRG